jgi:uncharacterized protein DUF6084
MIDVAFAFVSVRSEPHAAAPTIVLRLRISTSSGRAVHAGIVRGQLLIDPRRRRYTTDEAERVADLFGEPARWRDTMKTLLWTHVAIVVPAFEGSVEIDVPVACTYDFAIASSKFFHALDDGDVPVVGQFSGTLFVAATAGFEVSQVPWDAEAAMRVPASVWREAMDQHFPNAAWIGLSRDAFDALSRFRTRRALPSWEAAIDALCAEAEAKEPV